ncbi:hypothetical protein IWW50_005457, partial [Coemansia erecta]
MVFGWQKSPRSRRPVVTLPSVPSAIAEDGCEVVPQFFPGYQPRMPAAPATTASAAPFEKPQHAYEGMRPQRRAGSVRLSATAAAAQTDARPGDRHQQRSASVYPCSLEPRRASCTSTASSATIMSQQ